ncbi:MAG: MBL fold metallo-hydrolase [Pyrinomonadaceae bacterium]
MIYGDYRIEIIPDTEFRLDGGAMFGVVPRVLWERVSPPDESNRIRLNMNCVFIENGKHRIIIETGIGEKWNEKEIAMYGISRQKSFSQSLREITGYNPADITIVVNTHLHFDHSGGNTVRIDNEVRPQFPNATYFISKTELEHAENPSERDRASYLAENWRPMLQSGQIRMMEDTYQPIPGLFIQKVRGHSETMQTWRLETKEKTFYGFADLIPTRHHLRPAWIAGYDLFPMETLEFKKTILPRAVSEKWLCLLYHDPDLPLAEIRHDGKTFHAVPPDYTK